MGVPPCTRIYASSAGPVPVQVENGYALVGKPGGCGNREVLEHLVNGSVEQ